MKIGDPVLQAVRSRRKSRALVRVFVAHIEESFPETAISHPTKESTGETSHCPDRPQNQAHTPPLRAPPLLAHSLIMPEMILLGNLSYLWI